MSRSISCGNNIGVFLSGCLLIRMSDSLSNSRKRLCRMLQWDDDRITLLIQHPGTDQVSVLIKHPNFGSLL